MRAANLLLDIFYPSRCVICRSYMGPEPPGLCPKCMDAMPEPEGKARQIEFVDKFVSVFSYTGAYREAMLRYKFGGKVHYAKPFGGLLAMKVRQTLADQYDLITWLPIHRKRRRKRGYDQAKLLAVQTARSLGRKAVPTLRKIRNTPQQSGISSPAQRRANILNAYRAVRPDSFRGKRILLIDDILTTGATLSEAARTLLTAGAAKVVCGTVALTPNKQSR